MEAKATVMKPPQIKEAWLKACQENIALDMLNYPLVIVQAQAEISFKVGKTAGVAESLLPALKAIDDSRKAGIREVVEWFVKEINPKYISFDGKSYYTFGDRKMQAKLKEWGIE